MTNMRLGDLFIHARDEGLTLSRSGSVTELANVEIEDVPEIMDFLTTYLETSANRRSGFRLDLTGLDAHDYQRLHVSVLTDQGAIVVNPLNMSITGMYVESDRVAMFEGMDVIVRIMFEAHLVVLCGSVVRISESNRHFALHFPDVVADDGTLNPPSSLTALFAALESLWLDHALDLHWSVCS